MEPVALQTLSLDEQIERLCSGDWRMAEDVHQVLAAAGEAGIEAAVRGLSDPNPRIRRSCAEFMDHFGTDSCAEALSTMARRDAIPYVRRVAIHSFTCQRCKPAPLQADMVPLLIECAVSDSSPRVRREAIYGLSQQPVDPDVAEVLRAILGEDTNLKVRRSAHDALQRHDPAYRQECIEQAKGRHKALGAKNLVLATG